MFWALAMRMEILTFSPSLCPHGNIKSFTFTTLKKKKGPHKTELLACSLSQTSLVKMEFPWLVYSGKQSIVRSRTMKCPWTLTGKLFQERKHVYNILARKWKLLKSVFGLHKCLPMHSRPKVGADSKAFPGRGWATARSQPWGLPNRTAAAQQPQPWLLIFKDEEMTEKPNPRLLSKLGDCKFPIYDMRILTTVFH